MAVQAVKTYLVMWRSLIFGEVDFSECVQATSPEEACRIAASGEDEFFLELYSAEAKEIT